MALLTRTGLRINIYRSMADFPFFKMAAVRNLGFLNFNFRPSSEAQYVAIFCEHRSNRSEDIADFRFSRWRPSATLDFQKLEILTSG